MIAIERARGVCTHVEMVFAGISVFFLFNGLCVFVLVRTCGNAEG